MAKKKEKTLEEKLQEALVPENQWPYILPENWCWVKFGSLAKDMADGPFGSNLKTEHYINEKEVRIIQLSNVSENGWKDDNVRYTTFEHAKTISRSIVKPGDIVITKMMPAGRAMICPNLEKEYVLSSDSVKFVPWDCLDRKYMTLGINSTVFRKQVQENTQGITRARTSLKKLKSYIYPLAPLAEQKRIVYRIESLFAKLDEAKEKIQQVLDGAEMRKAAILHKAFTGELTKTWRKENSVSVSELLKNISEKLLKVKKKKIKKVSNLYSQRNIPHEWTWVELDDIAYKITDGEHATPKRVDNFCGFYLLSARNVRNDELKLDYVDYVAEDEYIRISKRCNPHMGDVLISCSGSVGRCCVITDNEKYVMVRSAAVISPILCNPKFIMYMIMSRDVQAQIKSLCKQTAQANLFIGAIASIKIPLPSLEEQDYIADLVGELFYKEKCSVEHCSKILFDIDTMKKSILAKAFRGELGTNNPTEDSALNLLKEVLQDKF